MSCASSLLLWSNQRWIEYSSLTEEIYIQQATISLIYVSIILFI